MTTVANGNYGTPFYVSFYQFVIKDSKAAIYLPKPPE